MAQSIREVMTENPEAVSGDSTVTDAAHRDARQGHRRRALG